MTGVYDDGFNIDRSRFAPKTSFPPAGEKNVIYFWKHTTHSGVIDENLANYLPHREREKENSPRLSSGFHFHLFFSLFLSVDDTIKGNHPFVCWLSHQVSIIFSYPTGDDTFSLTDLSQSPLHVWRVCCLLSLSLPCRVWRKSKRKFTSCYYYDSQQQQQQKIRRAVILPRSSSSSSRRRNNMIPNGNCDEQVAPESIRAHSNEGGSQSAITHTTVAERNPKNKRSHWWMYMCESSYIFKGCGEESAKWRCTQTPKEEEELEESSSSCTTTTVKGELYPPPPFFSLSSTFDKVIITRESLYT